MWRSFGVCGSDAWDFYHGLTRMGTDGRMRKALGEARYEGFVVSPLQG